MADFHLIPCKIERGGFSGERTFTIATGGGEPLIGVAYYEYFLDSNQKPISEDEPPEGQKLDGFVMCRIIRLVDDSTVIVEVPSSDTIEIQKRDLVSGAR
jgi:hypothetical protein